MTCKLTVVFRFRCVKIHVSAGNISVAFVYKRGNNADKVINTACRGLDNLRLLYIERVAIRKKCVRIELRDLHYSFMLALCALEHLILARIGIACKMPYVGYIHSALHVIAGKAQIFFKHILHYIAAQVAYVRIVIHRRPAGIHLYQAWIVGYELFFFVRCRII